MTLSIHISQWRDGRLEAESRWGLFLDVMAHRANGDGTPIREERQFTPGQQRIAISINGTRRAVCAVNRIPTRRRGPREAGVAVVADDQRTPSVLLSPLVFVVEGSVVLTTSSVWRCCRSSSAAAALSVMI